MNLLVQTSTVTGRSVVVHDRQEVTPQPHVC